MADKGRRPKTGAADQPSIYQIRVSLRDIAPPIWRRLLVTSDTRLSQLHRILQIAMGWENYHLHTFTVHGLVYSEPDPEWPDVLDERRVRLRQLALGRRSRFTYAYDMGDGWEHDVAIEAMVPPEESLRYPVCIGGERACPPEDVGGTPGYQDFLEAIADPEHEEHESLMLWAGEDFDPRDSIGTR